MDTEEIKTLLDLRAYLYQACQVILGTEPTEQSVSAFNSELTLDAFELVFQADQQSCKAAVDALRTTAEAWRSHPDTYLAQARHDYTKQFEGPNKLQAPPWECVYVTKERMLFQEQTLIVRNCYSQEGFKAAQAPHVSDDHIAIELDFMAKLSMRTAEAHQQSDAAECLRLLQSMNSFLSDHLLTWVPEYACDLAKAAPGSLYAATANGCAALLAVDSELIAELSAEIASSET